MNPCDLSKSLYNVNATNIRRIIILGPTASGKSAVAVELALKLQTPIISADSRQVYKFLDIGTAKISDEEMKGVTHFNISLLNPDEPDNATAFRKRSQRWEKELRNQHHKYIIYAGGSTLYLQAILFPMDNIPPANAENIAFLSSIAEAQGREKLYNRLKKADPDYAASMDGFNTQRMIRALDVYMQTGKPFSSFHNRDGWNNPEADFVFGLTMPRNDLYEKINLRVDKMVSYGLKTELQDVLNMGFSPDTQGLKTVGYKEIIDANNSTNISKDWNDQIKINSRRYAKRQLTFFKRWPFIKWIDTKAKTPTETANLMLQEIIKNKSDFLNK